MPKIYELLPDNNTLTVIEEYLSGETIQEILFSGTRFSDRDTLRILLDVCDILSRLHSSQPPIIHRDIKPSNLMIRPDGSIYLLDFNAAKYADDTRTSDTVLLGTAGYAAPEQYGFGASTIQTDIYSLGRLMQVMLTGRLDTPYSGPAASQALIHIIEKCTQLDSSHRYDSVSKLKQDLLAAYRSYGSNTNPQPQPSDDTVRSRSSQAPSWHRFLPPGFRTFQPLHMLTAAVMYFLIFYIGLGYENDRLTSNVLWMERIFLTLCLLFIAACASNYAGIFDHLPLCNSKNRWTCLIARVLFTAAGAVCLLVIMAILEATLSPV